MISGNEESKKPITSHH